MTDLPLPRPSTFFASQSNMPYYTSESSIVALRTPPDRRPTEGIMRIPQDRLSRAFSRTPSSHINSPLPILAMEKQPQDQRFLLDLDGSADSCTSSPTPDKYNTPPHQPAFRSPDLRSSNPPIPAIPSHSGSQELVLHPDRAKVVGDPDSNFHAVPPREDRDPSKRDAPSSTGFPVSDVSFLSGVSDSNRMSLQVSVSPANDAHPLGYHDWGFPSSSTGGAESLDFNRLPVRSPYHQRADRNTCPWANCAVRFCHMEDVERHVLQSHLPHSLYCPAPSCLWRGATPRVFKRHSSRYHPEAPHPVQPCLIYDAKSVLGNIFDHGMPVEMAQQYALQCVAEKALEVGKTEEWEDMKTIRSVNEAKAAGALKDTRHQVEHDVSETRIAEIKESVGGACPATPELVWDQDALFSPYVSPVYTS